MAPLNYLFFVIYKRNFFFQYYSFIVIVNVLLSISVGEVDINLELEILIYWIGSSLPDWCLTVHKIKAIYNSLFFHLKTVVVELNTILKYLGFLRRTTKKQMEKWSPLSV